MRWRRTLATRLAPHEIQVVCGPLVEGAFVASLVAARLGVPFTYADRSPTRSAPPSILSATGYPPPSATRSAAGAWA